MKATSYYRPAFALPVFLAALAIPLLIRTYSLEVFEILASEIVSSGASAPSVGIALLSLVSIPVAMASAPVAAGALFFLRRNDAGAHRRLARRAPVWLGLSTACTAVALVLVMETVSGDLLHFAMISAVLAVIAGYHHLNSAAIVFVLLRACSLIDPA